MMIRHFRIISWLMGLGCLLLVAACSSESDVVKDELQPLPEGMGRIHVTICTPEHAQTRAVNAVPWEDPDHEWERLQTFRILICQASGDEYEVKSVIAGTKDNLTEVTHTTATSDETPDPSASMSSTHKSGTFVSEPLTEGTYYIFAVANFTADEYAADYDVGKTIDFYAIKQYANSSNYYIVGDAAQDAKYNLPNIHMTGWLNNTDDDGNFVPQLKPIGLSNGEEKDAGTITVWRVMSKMQFEFTNESDKDIKILGIEVDPIYKVSSSAPGIYLFSKDDLESTDNLAPGTGVTLPDGARNDMGTVEFVPPTVDSNSQPLILAAKNDGDTHKGTLYFYINESDATFTTTNNQYSLRFKVQRKKDDGNWYDEEIRYGVTTHHDLGNNDPYGGYSGGFNVIRRNDWIHIPIVLTDWQLRIEPLAFVPIAGYPATTLSNDGLTATFSTGGMIALQPFIKKYSDSTWRSFGDSEITYGDVVMDSEDNTKKNDEASWAASIHWKNADGDTKSGNDKIVKTPFAYDLVTKCIIGELNNNLDAGNYTDNGISVYTKDGHRYFKTTFTVCLRLGPDDDETKQYVYTFTFNVILKKQISST